MDAALYVEKLMAPGECAAQAKEWEARGHVLDAICARLHHVGGYDTLPDAVRKVVRERDDHKMQLIYLRCALAEVTRRLDKTP